MARIKGTVHINAIPEIDLTNAPTCLACRLPECVYRLNSTTHRYACPVWRKENEHKVEYRRRQRAKQERTPAGTPKRRKAKAAL